MNRNTIRQTAVVLSVIAVITVNALANALPINGLNTGEISDRFEVFFVPAGYVFSIWGLIYFGLAAYAFYQSRKAQAEDLKLVSIGGLFVLSSIANIAWILLWHYEYFPLTVVVMLILLVTLIAICLRLDIGRGTVSSQMKWFVHVPFSIYLGWITVATIANITSLLYYLEWNAFGIDPEIWTVLMLAAAVAVGAVVSLTRGDVAYALVLIWAFIGIAVKHSDTELVAISAWIAAALTAVFVIVGAYLQRQRKQETIFDVAPTEAAIS
jgi:benzodiazapine receptor